MAEIIKYDDFKDILEWFNIKEAYFYEYMETCEYRGYPVAPAGSLWTGEGVVLGSITSTCQKVLETGRFRGVSTTFMIDGAIYNEHKKTEVVSIDIHPGGEDIPVSMLPWVDSKIIDSIEFLSTTSDFYDMIFLDDCHEFDHVCKEIQIISERKLTKNILFHDYFVTNNERSKVKEAIDSNREQFHELFLGKTEQSDCGLALGVLN